MKPFYLVVKYQNASFWFSSTVKTNDIQDTIMAKNTTELFKESVHP